MLSMLLALERLKISVRAEQRPAAIEIAPARASGAVALPAAHAQSG